jgi:hypothetical protein
MSEDEHELITPEEVAKPDTEHYNFKLIKNDLTKKQQPEQQGQLQRKIRGIEEHHFGGIPPKEVVQIIEEAKADFPKFNEGNADPDAYVMPHIPPGITHQEWEDKVFAWFKKWFGEP